MEKYAIPSEKIRELNQVGILGSTKQANPNWPDELDGIIIAYPPDRAVFSVRLDNPVLREGGKRQKYYRPSGVSPRLFIPPGLDLTGVEEVWITEGELKALCAWAYGLPVVALAGVWNWRRDVKLDEDPVAVAAKLTGPGGKAPDPEALIEDIQIQDWSGKTVALIYDSDITQEHPAWPAFGRLAEQLYHLGAAVVKVITLPAVPPVPGEEEDGEDKTGLDDYIRRRKALGFDPAAELQEVIRRAPEWVPTGGAILGCIEKVGTLEGLEKYAAARLSSNDPERMVLAAAAYYAAGRETMLQAALKTAGVRGEMAQAVKADGKAEAERIRERQAPRRAAAAQEPEPVEPQTVGSVWPDAPAETHQLRCPPGYKWSPDAVLATHIDSETGEIKEDPICDPVFVSAILDDVNSIERRYEITFRRSGRWTKERVKPSEIAEQRGFMAVLNRGLAIYDLYDIGTVMRYLHKVIYANIDLLPTGKYTTTAGRWGDVIVYPGGAWGKDGPVASPPIVYHDDRATPDFLLEVKPLPGGTAEDARQVLSKLVRCADPATAWAMAGWFAAALLAPLVRQAWGEFPILNVYGIKGSGKSSLIQAFYRTFYTLNSLGSARRPPFSILKELACSNMIPVVLDEYRTSDIYPQHLDNLHHYLRQAYRAGRETRGRPDQTTQDYYLTAPVVVLGESRIDEGAIRDRCVILPVAKSKIAQYPGAAEAYSSLPDEDALRRVAGWLWSRSLEVEAGEVVEVLKEIEIGLRGLGLPDRPRHNLAVVLFGAYWLNDLTGGLGTVPAEEIAEKFLRAEREEDTQVDCFIRFLELENSRPAKKRTIPMRMSGGELIVHATAAIEGYALHAKTTHQLFLGRDALKKELAEQEFFLGEKVKKFAGKAERCILFSVSALEKKYGIPADSWNTDWPLDDEGSGRPEDIPL
jgi:hypothetical protein